MAVQNPTTNFSYQSRSMLTKLKDIWNDLCLRRDSARVDTSAQEIG
jgi:hypothetical protein